MRKAYPFYRDIAQFWQSASLGWKRPQVQVLLFRPPWLARLSIDVPVTNPAQVISMFLPGITKLQRKLLLLNLRIGREVRIRRDAYTMGGNVAGKVSPQLRAQQ